MTLDRRGLVPAEIVRRGLQVPDRLFQFADRLGNPRMMGLLQLLLSTRQSLLLGVTFPTSISTACRAARAQLRGVSHCSPTPLNTPSLTSVRWVAERAQHRTSTIEGRCVARLTLRMGQAMPSFGKGDA